MKFQLFCVTIIIDSPVAAQINESLLLSFPQP
jgi:hypothetical protein